MYGGGVQNPANDRKVKDAMDILIEAISFPLRGGSRSSRRSPSSTGARAAAAPARAVSRDINQLSWKYSICKVITSTLLLSMSPYIATLLGGVVSGTVGSATTTAISFATIITQYAFSSISSIARAAFTTDGLTLCSIIGLGQIASAWSELALTPSERFSTITHIREVWERRGSLATSSIMCVFNKNIEVFARAYRFMEANSPPIRIVVPGKCYRYEATDATHEWHFYQIEGLVVDKGINFSNLKGTLYEFAKRVFGNDRKVRFRCDYFPFVEPGVDMSISNFKDSEGNRPIKGRDEDWIEILGAGMVHPEVLRGVGYDPDIYTGFAFGMGPERISMLRDGIDDIRHFYSNDLRFLGQFV